MTMTSKSLQEPIKMVNIDLETNKTNEEQDMRNSLQSNKQRLIKAVLVASSVCLIILIITASLDLEYSLRSQVDNNSPQEPMTHAKILDYEKCRSANSFEDCCNILVQFKLLAHQEKCTLVNLLTLFLRYQFKINQRHKRNGNYYENGPFNDRNYEEIRPIHRNYEPHGPQYKNYEDSYNIETTLNRQPFIEQNREFFRNRQDIASNKQMPTQFQIPLMTPWNINNHEQTYNNPEFHTSKTISFNEESMGRNENGSEIPTTEYNQNQNLDQKFMNNDKKEYISSNSSNSTNTKKLKSNSGNKVETEEHNNKATNWKKEKSAHNVINTAKTKSANKANSSEEPRIVASSQNNSDKRISNNFETKQKVDNFANVLPVQSSQSNVLTPCYMYPLPFGQPIRQSVDTNPMISVISQQQQQQQQQPVYVLNPPVYSYVPSNGYGSQMINPYYYYANNVVKNPVQVQSSSGQFYSCSPIPPPTAPSIVNIPGVEIRHSLSLFNLKSSPKIQSNKTMVKQALLCPIGQHSCTDGSKCISLHQLCDNEINCPDGSDEMLCSCKHRIGEVRQCDGYFDCPNGEDEQGCFGCKDNELSCDNWSKFKHGTCITTEQRCDGIRQCEITGKDEEDCSALTDNFHNQDSLIISNSVGFLHRNYKGKWYPMCGGSESAALDICKAEAGPSNMHPKSAMVPVSGPIHGPFINIFDSHQVNFTNNCIENHAAFVECPPILCGLRFTIRNPFRSTEVDTSVEDLLIGFEKFAETKNETVGSSRIVGGKACQPAAWPWVASIYKNGVFHCGGVLISDSWVVTAAHCVTKYWFFYYEVQLGMLRRFSHSPMEQIRSSSVIIANPDYDRKTLRNDIALMKLSSPIRFNRYVRPICLPSEVTAGRDFLRGPPPSTVCTTVGWGATVEHGTDPDHLREVEVPILANCKHTEDRQGGEICAGLLEGGRDACQGDSGGPLMCRNTNDPSQWYLAGIVSHGEGCARPDEPGVYTKVSDYLGWITENMRNEKMFGKLPLQKCPGYVCQGTGKCLAKKHWCDKTIDCLLGDDELNCLPASDMNLDRVVLGSSHNININNTNITSEDSNEMAGNYNEKAMFMTTLIKDNSAKSMINDNAIDPKAYFRCKILLQVIPVGKKCDRIIDCEDGTDEMNCSCIDYIRSTNKELICDGVTDCKDMSDEVDCVKCLPSERLCLLSQRCIPLSNWCDGITDCVESEDERDCVALTDGKTLTLDSDLRPSHGTKGVITINRLGVWRPLCTNTSDMAPSIAANICNLLGFRDYLEFRKISIESREIPITIHGFASLIFTKADNDSCSGIFVKCIGTKGGPRPPWEALIFIGGQLQCVGVLMGSQWIVVSTGCVKHALKNKKYMIALLGTRGRNLDVETPHETIIPFSKIIKIPNSEISLLRLGKRLHFSRYIKVAQFRSSFVGGEEDCMALGVASGQMSSISLRSWTNCTWGFRCFRPLHIVDNDRVWNGTITCKSRDGWYPAAVFSDLNNITNSQFTTLNHLQIELRTALMNGKVAKIEPETCNGFRCTLGNCIEKKQLCNGIADCKNGEDEDFELCEKMLTSCHLHRNCTCLNSELQCFNGKCISKFKFCDGRNDCGDFSDEPSTCSCRNYLMLSSLEKICDGVLNCLDRSDEDANYCPCPQNNTRFRCEMSNRCVSRDVVCDGTDDCPNGEDELQCYSLKPFSNSSNSGQVMTRTGGVWHSGCFNNSMTTSQLEDVCDGLGFSGGSARKLQIPENISNITSKVVKDSFSVVWLRRTKNSKMKMWIRSGREPFISFINDTACQPLFIECL